MDTIDVPCPECNHTPVRQLEVVDGTIWICPACGYQEITAGVDIEAQLTALADYDPDMAARWRQTLGL